MPGLWTCEDSNYFRLGTIILFGLDACCGARFERPEFAFLLRLAFANCARGVKHRNISLTIYEVKVLRFSVFLTGASIEISWGFVGAARDNRSCNK